MLIRVVEGGRFVKWIFFYVWKEYIDWLDWLVEIYFYLLNFFEFEDWLSYWFDGRNDGVYRKDIGDFFFVIIFCIVVK